VRDLAADKGNLELDCGSPVPDLVVEVDITSPSLEKPPICYCLGIPEVWRHDGERLVVFLVDEASAGGEASYVAAPESAILPGATGDALTRLAAEGLSWTAECRGAGYTKRPRGSTNTKCGRGLRVLSRRGARIAHKCRNSARAPTSFLLPFCRGRL
jgi:hypothetical protein